MPTVQSFKAPKKVSSSASLLLEKRFCGLEYNLHVRYQYQVLLLWYQNKSEAVL